MKKIKTLLLIISILGVSVVSTPALAKTVGIWYEVLYSKEKNYNWNKNFGVGAQNKLVGDVNGDGKEDSAIYLNYNSQHHRGAFHVSLSDGSKFTTQSEWLDRSTVDPSGAKTFLSDVNGDGKDDAIIYYDNKNGGVGVWEVALSTGTSFQQPTEWFRGYGLGQNYFVEDVNGDNKSDAVVFIDTGPAQGNWYVALSNGSGFNQPSHWVHSTGHTSNNQFLKDVTGDGKADAIAFWGSGDWHVANSTGITFSQATVWKQNWGTGSTAQMVGDTNGDAKGDAVIYWQAIEVGHGGEQGAMYSATSTGSVFTGTTSSVWNAGHGNWIHHNKVGPANNLFLADVDGDSKDESVAYHELHTNNTGAGKWKVMFDGYKQPDQQNYWDALTIEHMPVGGKYDSGNPVKIQEHLTQIDNAGVDFILIDLTNGVKSHTWIFNRAKAVCNQLAVHNANGGSLKFAIATGKVQYTNVLNDVEVEAQEVLDDFVNDPTCGAHYYQTNNKPFLEAHFNSYEQKQAWLNVSHPVTNGFEVKYGMGKVPYAPNNVPSASGTGCGVISNPTPPLNDMHNFIGWTLPYGTVTTGPYATVMPGSNNKHGTFMSRWQHGIEAGFYMGCGWERVQQNKSIVDTVVINSYNEYAEETAVAPTETNQLTTVPPVSEGPWAWPSLYWDHTVTQISAFKN